LGARRDADLVTHPGLEVLGTGLIVGVKRDGPARDRPDENLKTPRTVRVERLQRRGVRVRRGAELSPTVSGCDTHSGRAVTFSRSWAGRGPGWVAGNVVGGRLGTDEGRLDVPDEILIRMRNGASRLVVSAEPVGNILAAHAS